MGAARERAGSCRGIEKSIIETMSPYNKINNNCEIIIMLYVI